MIALRFTREVDESGRISTDSVNHRALQGLCAYDISEFIERMTDEKDGYTFEEACQLAARSQAEFDNFHAHNHRGHFVIFDGREIEKDRDNQDFEGKRAVVVELKEYYGHGKIDQAKYGWVWNFFHTA